jgi:hypothetical protein
MVTVQNYAIRQNSDGEEFIVLILQGGLEMVQSQETGKYYATIRKASVSSTFDEETAKQMLGQQLSGNIIRIECDPYEYVVEETGEQLLLSHSYEYQPEEAVPVVTQPAPAVLQSSKKLVENGMELAV